MNPDIAKLEEHVNATANVNWIKGWMAGWHEGQQSVDSLEAVFA